MRVTLLIFIVAFLFSCNREQDNGFFQDANYYNQVKEDYKKVNQQFKTQNDELFLVFQQNLSGKEKEALEFLYAYMPTNDLADYNSDFFLRNVRLAFLAQEEMPWGKSVPEDIFRHFVLPHRVNNENLDSARLVFYDDIKSRVQKLSMKEATLEVNKWCREHVIYKSTDERTISPLGAMKSAYGRCGEESTFTVTALRSVGIPARQCYTPRWAHADDNHAWVEVWVDGTWYYLGACEPKLDLNIAWFTEPANRAMLVHTKVFGKYNGSESVINRKEKYTEINVLKTYAPVKEIFVKVIDQNDLLIQNANVEFQLYNYAEYYPIASKLSNEEGLVSLETGFGDLLIWVRKNDAFAYKKITVTDIDTVEINLTDSDFTERIEDWLFIPPTLDSELVINTQNEEENQLNLVKQDTIREQYISTFISEKEVNDFCKQYQLSVLEILPIFEASRGNWVELKKFIENAQRINSEYTIDFLKTLSKKDLRDVSSEIMLGLYQAALSIEHKNEQFIPFVLNPRIGFEGLVDYKSFLSDKFEKLLLDDHHQLAMDIKNWINQNITLTDDNYYKVQISPIGVYKSGVSDKRSRDIFFVAVSRSLGLPSRLEPASGEPQYYCENQWNSISFETKSKINAPKTGRLIWQKAEGIEQDIEYRVHFSLSVFNDGRYNILEYGWGKKYSEMEKELELKIGHYLLITSQRDADGAVSTSNNFFDITEGHTIVKEINFSENIAALKPISNLTGKLEYILESGEKDTVDINNTCVLAWIINNEETSIHTLNDISSFKSQFEKEELRLYLFFNSIVELKSFDYTAYDLPENAVFAVHSGKNPIVESIKTYPLYTLVKEKKLYFTSQGYRIGMGDFLIRAKKRLDNNKTCRIE